MNEKIVDYRNKRSKLFRGRTLSQFIFLSISTLLYNIIGYLNSAFKVFYPTNLLNGTKRLIILGYGGIGNHLMLSSAIRCLKESAPDYDINVVVSSQVCADLLKSNQDISSLFVMNIGEMNSLSDYIHAGKRLNKIAPDVVLVASGTDPVAGSLISFFSKARIRIGENWRGRGFLYTHKIKADQSSSELDQNVALAKFLEITVPPTFPRLYLDPSEISEGEKWIAEKGISSKAKILGIHPGCGKQQEWKRWDIENYIKVVEEITKKTDAKVIFFCGPDDNDLIPFIKSADISSAKIYKGEGSIRKTSAIIGFCNIFLSNDSGLRHIAVALGVSTIGIFGPTSLSKNFLGDENHMAVFQENIACRPCHYKKWWLACGDSRPCLEMITVEKLVALLFERLKCNNGHSLHTKKVLSTS
jgi:heptosyltransferase-2